MAGALRAVERACDEFRHTHLLANTTGSGPALYGLVFEAKVGTATLRGIDLIALDEQDQIARFEVVARPMAALMALASRMSGAAPAQQP